MLYFFLAVLTRPLEGLFYHADLCAAYHIFAAAFVYLTAWLNALVKTTRLQHRLQDIRDDTDLFRAMGTCNRHLIKAYLGGHFLLPNLIGPIWICWIVNANNRFLDQLAHLYGFAIGLLHMPLLVSLAINLVVPSVFCVLRWLVERTSRLVWEASKVIPQDPAAAAQRCLAALHDWLERLPEKIVDAIDRRLLRAEWVFMQLATAFAIAAYSSMLYTMIIDLYRPYLQRFAIHLTAQILMFVGDALFDTGRWVESIVVERGFWEGIGLWETMNVVRKDAQVTYS
ncbi:hypothetical protein ColLi_01128 [Colletotrichum liriopes]|uniref:Uncharacterized protein n=1 Tax=Colletotrichum liriopes TaxID=708192 RepID=A0AA37GCD5_9PEZI|nr:hypothetical protein ColLi_01128 [Colletotrichum liriopes]